MLFDYIQETIETYLSFIIIWYAITDAKIFAVNLQYLITCKRMCVYVWHTYDYKIIYGIILK